MVIDIILVILALASAIISGKVAVDERKSESKILWTLRTIAWVIITSLLMNRVVL